MRISDWSSDVCSSDLVEAPVRPVGGGAAVVVGALVRRVVAPGCGVRRNRLRHDQRRRQHRLADMERERRQPGRRRLLLEEPGQAPERIVAKMRHARSPPTNYTIPHPRRKPHVRRAKPRPEKRRIGKEWVKTDK